jgi:ATP phosphoribosyltransferase
MGSPSGSESESLLKLKLEASNEAKDRADQIITQLSNQIERQNNQLEAFNEARTRSDTIIMQLSQQIDRQQLQLEDMRRNRSIFARIRDVFVPSGT